MNKPDPNIDELLNSFIDGELTENQQADVARLVACNPQVEQRLQQFQKTKMLISSLPRDKAPRDMVERVKALLAIDAKLAEQRRYREKRIGMRQLLARRVLAAAAMIALVAVLGAVVYTILAPENIPEQPTATVAVVEPGPTAASLAKLSGRLELRTGALTAVDAFINGAIEGNGLSDCVTIERQPNQGMYSINCSRQELKLLLADLQSIWQQFNSARLYVDTEQFNTPIVIDAVTVEQATKVIGQDNPQKSIEVAKDFAVLNSMAELMPGKQISTAVDDKGVDLIPIPKPVLTGDRKKTERTSIAPPRHKPEVSLTIVVTGNE
jgi:uncharacterized membrane protein